MGLTEVLAFLKDTTPEREKQVPMVIRETEAPNLNRSEVQTPGNSEEPAHISMAKTTVTKTGGIFKSNFYIKYAGENVLINIAA